MIPFNKLIALFTLANEPWSSYYYTEAPTANSLKKIQDELGVNIPEDYKLIPTACPSYGVWLAGLGEDYKNSLHILQLNQVFHLDGEGYQRYLII